MTGLPLTRKSESGPVWFLIAVRAVTVLLAVGTFYLWHDLFDLSTPVAIVGSVVIWCSPGYSVTGV